MPSTLLLDTQSKVVDPTTSVNELSEILAGLTKPVVFTNGCFDILHRGHTTYLEQARNLGASLVVGVNSDDSVRRQNKGSDRPINPLEDRMSVLASLQCVDAVVCFHQDTPLNVIKAIMPDHLVKGGDWKIADIVGGTEVAENGGEVHSLEFKYQRSTTTLLEKIRS